VKNLYERQIVGGEIKRKTRMHEDEKETEYVERKCGQPVHYIPVHLRS
jgi:hypothetical protein